MCGGEMQSRILLVALSTSCTYIEYNVPSRACIIHMAVNITLVVKFVPKYPGRSFK